MKPNAPLELEDNPLCSLAEIQRRYFAPGCAPSKTVFKRWIAVGEGGVFLDAVLLDGRYYVRASAFEAFLDGKVAPRKRPRRRFSRNVDAALAQCVALGVKLDVD